MLYTVCIGELPATEYYFRYCLWSLTARSYSSKAFRIFCVIFYAVVLFFMIVAIFKDTALYSPYVNRRFGRTYDLHLQGRKSVWQETSVQQVTGQNCSRFLYGLHGNIFLKMAAFISAAVRTSNPTFYSLVALRTSP
jgi:hypothetical protein